GNAFEAECCQDRSGCITRFTPPLVFGLGPSFGRPSQQGSKLWRQEPSQGLPNASSNGDLPGAHAVCSDELVCQPICMIRCRLAKASVEDHRNGLCGDFREV